MQKESKYAIFNFQENDSDLIEGLSSYLDDHAEEIYSFFEVEPPKDKVIINIIPTKKEYDDLCRQRLGLNLDDPVPDWLIGNCSDRGVITYLSLHDYNSTVSHAYKEEDYPQVLEYYKKTIVHEYVHFVHKIFNKIHNRIYPAKFLGEGIACYLSKQREGKTLFLKSSKEKIANDKNTSYDDYYLITKYLVENYSKEYVLEVFQGTRDHAIELLNEIYDKVKEECNQN